MAPPSGDDCRSKPPVVVPRVGDQVQLWSRTAGLWCDGQIVDVQMGMVVKLVVQYAIPNLGLAHKVVLPCSVNLRLYGVPRGLQDLKGSQGLATLVATCGKELEKEADMCGSSVSSSKSASRRVQIGQLGQPQIPESSFGDPNALREGLIVAEGRFELFHELGSGSFSTVRLAKDLETGREVALKFESGRAKHLQLIEEARRYRHFSGGDCVPKLHWYGTDLGFHVMAIDLLGPSLEAVLEMSGRALSVTTVAYLGKQMLDCLEFIHSRDFVHRDLKPQNFCVGVGKDRSKVFCIDFGLAKRYREYQVGKGKVHIPFRGGLSFVGTVRYASLAAHIGEEQSRRDDLEAFLYVLIYLLHGSLPWQGVAGETKEERRQRVLEIKQSLPLKDLCEGSPWQFLELAAQITEGMSWSQEPDYRRFREYLDDVGLVKGGHSWQSQALESLGDGDSQR